MVRSVRFSLIFVVASITAMVYLQCVPYSTTGVENMCFMSFDA